MKKEVMIAEVLAKLDDLGVSYNIGKDTDISINWEVENVNFTTRNKNIKYFATVYFNEYTKTVFMWEVTKEKRKGFPFSDDGDTCLKPGVTQFYTVNTIKYDTGENPYEYILDLGVIPNVFKDIAKEYGWAFKMVLKREKALYPLGYFGSVNKNYKEALNKDVIKNNKSNYKLLYWALFSILLVFDLILFIGGSGFIFFILSSIVLISMLVLKKKFSTDVMRLLFSFLMAFMITFIIFGVIGLRI